MGVFQTMLEIARAITRGVNFYGSSAVNFSPISAAPNQSLTLKNALTLKNGMRAEDRNKK